MKTIELHTDGCSLKNPGNSGAGIVLIYEGRKKEFAIPLGHSTNMRAELSAVIEGLKLVKEACEIHIFSDCEVVIDIINGTKQAASNLDLWKEYQKESMFHKIVANWNRKDSTAWNKKCHELANKAARSQKLWEG